MANDREERVGIEYNRIKDLFKDIEPNKLKLVDGLITQAARLRVNLDDNWKDIGEGGDYEMFTQSVNTDPYERERPVARLYNTRDQSYQRIMKQLSDLMQGNDEEEKGNKYNPNDLL